MKSIFLILSFSVMLSSISAEAMSAAPNCTDMQATFKSFDRWNFELNGFNRISANMAAARRKGGYLRGVKWALKDTSTIMAQAHLSGYSKSLTRIQNNVDTIENTSQYSDEQAVSLLQEDIETLGGNLNALMRQAEEKTGCQLLQRESQIHLEEQPVVL